MIQSGEVPLKKDVCCDKEKKTQQTTTTVSALPEDVCCHKHDPGIVASGWQNEPWLRMLVVAVTHEATLPERDLALVWLEKCEGIRVFVRSRGLSLPTNNETQGIGCCVLPCNSTQSYRPNHTTVSQTETAQTCGSASSSHRCIGLRKWCRDGRARAGTLSRKHGGTHHTHPSIHVGDETDDHP